MDTGSGVRDKTDLINIIVQIRQKSYYRCHETELPVNEILLHSPVLPRKAALLASSSTISVHSSMNERSMGIVSVPIPDDTEYAAPSEAAPSEATFRSAVAAAAAVAAAVAAIAFIPARSSAAFCCRRRRSRRARPSYLLPWHLPWPAGRRYLRLSAAQGGNVSGRRRRAMQAGGWSHNGRHIYRLARSNRRRKS